MRNHMINLLLWTNILNTYNYLEQYLSCNSNRHKLAYILNFITWLNILFLHIYAKIRFLFSNIQIDSTVMFVLCLVHSRCHNINYLLHCIQCVTIKLTLVNNASPFKEWCSTEIFVILYFAGNIIAMTYKAMTYKALTYKSFNTYNIEVYYWSLHCKVSHMEISLSCNRPTMKIPCSFILRILFIFIQGLILKCYCHLDCSIWSHMTVRPVI